LSQAGRSALFLLFLGFDLVFVAGCERFDAGFFVRADIADEAARFFMFEM